MIKSQTIRYSDFFTDWYTKWSKLLKQEEGFDGIKYHNKGWQNAIILQAANEHGAIIPGNKALGFGVGIERIPSALANLGINVVATDQNFINGKKAGWDNGQLAHRASDLNKFKICSQKMFNSHVIYKNCDMNNISKAFTGKFDLVWSNCALGHLGSIENGLSFIENSLSCLKPGGVAIHTTEVNIFNQEKTLDKGGTVIFRPNDLYNLFRKLRKRGYDCKPLILDFGSDDEDLEVKFHPYTDENLLKIHVGGFILSQIVLIIKKPREKKLNKTNIYNVFEQKRNNIRIAKFHSINEPLKRYIANQTHISLQGPLPIKDSYALNIKPGQTKSLTIKYINNGEHAYYDMYHNFHTSYPLVLVTSRNVNRISNFAANSWHSPNRPTVSFHRATQDENWGAINPGQEFTATIDFTAPKDYAGTFVEHFELALEGLGVFDGTVVAVNLVIK